jgi:Fe(3+) dicitrate transport protein
VLFAPSPYSAPAAYYFPLITRMTAVEVYKGPGAIRYGPQTVGGAINLRTREVPTSTRAALDLALGSRGVTRVHGFAGTGNATWGLLAEGVVLRDGGFKVLDGGGPTGFTRSEWMFKGRATPGGAWKQQLELKATFSLEHSDETYVGLSAEDFATSPYRRYASTATDAMDNHRISLVGSWSAQPTEALRLSVQAYRHDFVRLWRRLDHFRLGPELYGLLLKAPGSALEEHYLQVLRGAADSANLNESLMQLDNLRGFVAQGVQALAHLEVHTGPVAHELELSARFHHDAIHRDHTQAGYSMVAGALAADGQPREQLALNTAYTRALAFHLSDTLSFGRLLLAPGARLEVVQSFFGDQLAQASSQGLQVVPLLGLGAVVALPLGLNVFAGVHQGFSPVSPGQSSEVKAERATHFELGLRAPSKKRRLEVIGFWSEYTNITGECTGSTGCANDNVNRQFNGGAARILGLEALAGLTVALGKQFELSASVTYTLTSARFLSDFTSDNPIWGAVRAGDLLPYVPMHQATGRLTLTRDALSVSVGLEVNGALLEEAGNGSTQPWVPTRSLLDAAVSYQFENVRLYVQGNNLLNQSTLVARRPYGARPLAPLSVQGGIKVDWP